MTLHCPLSSELFFQRLLYKKTKDRSILDALLNPLNAGRYQLAHSQAISACYFLKCNPWEDVIGDFNEKKTQRSLIKALRSGLQQSDICPEDCADIDEYIIEPHGEHWVKISVAIIDTIADDYFSKDTYEWVLCDALPKDDQLMGGKLYLFKTQQAFNCIVLPYHDQNQPKHFAIDITHYLNTDQIDELELTCQSSSPNLSRHTLTALSKSALTQGFCVKGIHEMQHHYLTELSDLQKTSFTTHQNQLVPIDHLEVEHSPLSPAIASKRLRASVGTGDQLLPFSMNLTCPDKISAIQTQTAISSQLARKRQHDPNHHQPFLHDGISWEYLGAGSYNDAYISNGKTEGPEVLKVAKNKALYMDAPERSVRVFNEMNPELPQAKLSPPYWVLPFVQGRPPSPEEQGRYILQTYLTTGRIILDGYCIDNLLQDAQGKIACIDPGNAVRRDSISSKKYWYDKTPSATARVHTYIDHMLKTIEQYKACRALRRASPIFIILSLDFCDRKMRDHGQPPALAMSRYNNVLLLGMCLCAYYRAQIKDAVSQIQLPPHFIEDLLLNTDFQSIDFAWDAFTEDKIQVIIESIQNSAAISAASTQPHSASFFPPVKQIDKPSEVIMNMPTRSAFFGSVF